MRHARTYATPDGGSRFEDVEVEFNPVTVDFQERMRPAGRVPEFDIIVIGAGSAGCALAGDLCRRFTLKVCLVEAGPDYGPLDSGRWPDELLDPRRRPDTHDWGYLEERAGEPPLPETRAKVIGGCSAHNQCAAVWPPLEDFDQWAAAGNCGWSASELAALISEIRRMVPTAPVEDDQLASWQRCFLHAALEARLPRLADVSDAAPPQGVAPFHANIVNGVRWNAAFAFLDSVRIRGNLSIISTTTVNRLLLDGPTATGVICQSDRGLLATRSVVRPLRRGLRFADGSVALRDRAS